MEEEVKAKNEAEVVEVVKAVETPAKPEKPAERKEQRPSYNRTGYNQNRSRPQGGPGGNYRQQGRPFFRKKVCKLCVQKLKTIDYKDINMMRKFVTDRGKILPRRITGTCAKHQRVVSKAIMRARMIALLPFVSK